MLRKAVKIRLYPTEHQKVVLAQHFGCSRWWWNYGLNKSIETYKATGKGLSQSGLNSLLPALKKQAETSWLKDCYSQVLQSVSLNLSRAYQNFFEGRARYPRFKSKHRRQSIQSVSRKGVAGHRLGQIKLLLPRNQRRSYSPCSD